MNIQSFHQIAYSLVIPKYNMYALGCNERTPPNTKSLPGKREALFSLVEVPSYFGWNVGSYLMIENEALKLTSSPTILTMYMPAERPDTSTECAFSPATVWNEPLATS